MMTLAGEQRTLEPVGVECTEIELIVALVKDQKIVTPPWWYPKR